MYRRCRSCSLPPLLYSLTEICYTFHNMEKEGIPMKKRLIGAGLALILCLSLLPAGAEAAAGRIPIYLGYADVDYLAEQILQEIPTAGKSATEQIRAVYDYIIRNYQRYDWDGTEHFDRQEVALKAQAAMGRMEEMLDAGQIVLRQDLEQKTSYDPNMGFLLFTYDDSYTVASCAYDMILARTGTCQHFAALLTLLLGHLGFDCRMIAGEFINGNGSRVEHKWNCVLVDGQYYWLDVRMDHAGYESTGRISYTYFMKTSKSQWQERHAWDDQYSDWLFANAASIQASYDQAAAKAAGPWGRCSNWAREAMAQAGEVGLIPDRLAGADLSLGISRSEFASAALRFYQLLTDKKVPAFTGANPFTDTDDPEVLQAYGLGIVGGVGDGLYAPDRILTRQEAVVMLGRVWELAENGAVGDGSALPAADLGIFADSGDIAGYARGYVGFFVGSGAIEGAGDNLFSPKKQMTREQAIKVAFTAMQALGSNR